jgi:hypothetical protein
VGVLQVAPCPCTPLKVDPRLTATSGRGNMERLAEHNISATYVPVGFSRQLALPEPPDPPQIDVLFFGTVLPRRQKIIQELRDAGLKVSGDGIVEDPTSLSANQLCLVAGLCERGESRDLRGRA